MDIAANLVYTWMSQEVSKWVIAYKMRCLGVMTHLPFTNFLGHPSNAKHRLSCFFSQAFHGTRLFLKETLDPLHETNIAPKGNDRIPTIHFEVLLLMEEILHLHQLRLVVFLVIFKVLYIPGG